MKLSPKCRLDAILPISADRTYEYLLCKTLIKENYKIRFGGFQYDEQDGEVSYRYSFLISHGLQHEDLKILFFAVANTAANSFEMIRKDCIGKYKIKDVEEIMERVNNLVKDINDA